MERDSERWVGSWDHAWERQGEEMMRGTKNMEDKYWVKGGQRESQGEEMMRG